MTTDQRHPSSEDVADHPDSSHDSAPLYGGDPSLDRARHGDPQWPRIGIGDNVRLWNRDFKVVGMHEMPECKNALAFRLRCTQTGAHDLALVSDVHADIIANRSAEARLTNIPEYLTGTAGFAAAAHSSSKLDYLGAPYDRATAGSVWQSALTGPAKDETWTLAPDHTVDGVDVADAAKPSETGLPNRVVKRRGEGRSSFGLDRQAVLEGLAPKAAAAALEKEQHVLEVTTGFRSGDPDDPLPGEPLPEYTTPLLKDRLKAKAAELGLTDRTVRNWVDWYEADELFGLLDQRSARRLNPLAGIDPRIISAAIEQRVVVEGNEATGEKGRFYKRLKRRLDHQYGEGAVPLPPRTTLMPKLKTILGPSGTFGPSPGRRSKDRTPTHSFNPLRASRPGQSVLMDATPLDIRAYDPINDVDVTVSLSMTLDVATHTICSWRLVIGTENRADAILLIADALRPEAVRPGWKKHLAARLLALPEELTIHHDDRFEGAAAHPVIYMTNLSADHGKINVSKDCERACRVLRISKRDARKFQPTDKAAVERLFRTIGSGFAQHVAGYTGGSVARRGLNTDGQARWTVDELEEFLAYWVVHIYQNTRTRALPAPGAPNRFMTPNQAYAMLVSCFGWVPAPVDDDLYFRLLPVHWVEFSRAGAKVNYRTYDADVLRLYDTGTPSDYLAPLTAKGRRPGREEGRRLQGEKWPIRIDPNDITIAWFYSPQHEAWFPLQWVAAPDPDLPMTDLMFRQTRAWMEEHGLDSTLEAEVAAAAEEFYLRVGAPETWTAKSAREVSREMARARTLARDKANHSTPAAVATTPGQHLTAVPDITTHSSDTAADADDDYFDPLAVAPRAVASFDNPTGA
ncbi:helix-turn-helix domain-containing protein [Nocardioides sp. URHA0020]|uniref:helix-turn-helix domain-containing protein n=1 Tax=Nocardioides sp. URHA0020 TaxID=1380392 RepID=UPI0006849C08|nr:helix-turn-helix domain-containing protein [Nocardioides sp. URHA0020]